MVGLEDYSSMMLKGANFNPHNLRMSNKLDSVHLLLTDRLMKYQLQPIYSERSISEQKIELRRVKLLTKL